MADSWFEQNKPPSGPTLAPPPTVEQTVSSKTPKGWFEQFSPERHPENAPYVGRLTSESLPAIGATLSGPEAPLGAALGTSVKTLLRSYWPGVFGEAPQTVPDLAGEAIKDQVTNTLIPKVISNVVGGGINVAKAIKEGTLGVKAATALSSAPAVREGIARSISQDVLSQYTRPEEQILSDAAKEATRRRGINVFRPEGNPTGAPLYSTNPNEYRFTLDPVATQEWQAGRFGESAPYQPITFKPKTASYTPIGYTKNPSSEMLPIPEPQLEDFPLPKKPQLYKSTPGANAQAEKIYQDALTKRNNDYQTALTKWKIDTADLRKFTKEINNQVIVGASGPTREIPTGAYESLPSGPLKNILVSDNTIGSKLLQLKKDIDAGVEVTNTQNFRDISRQALSDVNQVRNWKMVAGADGVEQLALNDLLRGSKEGDILDAKGILTKLEGKGTSDIYNEALSPATKESFKGLMTEIQKQQDGKGIADSLVRYSNHKLYWMTAGLGGLTHPGAAIKAAAGAGLVKITNSQLERIMANPDTARLVTQAIRTPQSDPISPLLNQALLGVMRGAGVIATTPEK